MQQLTLTKYRCKDAVLDDTSAVWEVKQIPGVQLAQTLRNKRMPNRFAWRIFSSPNLAVRSRPSLGVGVMLTVKEQAANALIESLRGQSFHTRREAIQALEVKALQMDLRMEITG